MRNKNLNPSQIKFLERHNALDMQFDYVDHNLYTLETIRDNNLLSDDTLIEKVLQLPKDRQSEVLTQLEKKGIDVELMSNKDLTPEQFSEYLTTAHYNYNIEYGHLKDTGRIPVSKELISDPTLTPKQLEYIRQAYSEQLIPEKLFKDNTALSENEMYEALTELRTNNLEYNIRLSEVNVSSKRLTDIENKNLLALYIDGKENQQSANLFNKIITSNEFSSMESRSQYIANELGYELQQQKDIEQSNDPLVTIASKGEKLENLTYLHDDDMVQGWLNDKPDLIKPENAALIKDYYFMEYGINTAKNDIAKIEQSSDFIKGKRNAVDLHKFNTDHLNRVEEKLKDFITSGNLDKLNQTFAIGQEHLLDTKPLDYKSMTAPLDRHQLIEPNNLLQLLSNANNYAKELNLVQKDSLDNVLPVTNNQIDSEVTQTTQADNRVNQFNDEVDPPTASRPYYILRGGNQPELINQDEEAIAINKPTPQRESLEDLSKNFIPMSVDGLDYLESPDKTVRIHDDHVAINDLSPASLDLAISATIAKFGTPLVVEGSKEFEEAILKTLAENEKFSDIEIADPKLQAKLDEQRSEFASKVEAITFTPEQIKENATYYFVDDYDDLRETGKTYSIEVNGGYLAFDTKEELISAIAHEKGLADVNVDLTEDLTELYNNGTISEFEKEISEEYDFKTTSVIETIDHEQSIEQENE